MKTIIALVFLTILIASCGRDSDRAEIVRPVDAWMPFGDFMPERGNLDVRAHEPGPGSAGDLPLQRIHAVWQEVERINNFFGGFAFTVDSPDFFGGFTIPAINPFYITVFIVHDKIDEAREFLEYIRDFETVVIEYTEHSVSTLLSVSSAVMASEIWPRLWEITLDITGSRVNVLLINYTDEEKTFFTENVIDSPVVRFLDFFQELGEETFMRFILGDNYFLYNPAGLPSNELDSVSISAEVEEMEIVFQIYNEAEDMWQVHLVFIEAYLNGRWIPILRMPHDEQRFLPFTHWSPMPAFTQGRNVYRVSTANITRHFEGPFKANFIVTHFTLSSRFTHHLYHIFN